MFKLKQLNIRPKKNICVFTVTCQKNLRSVRINFFLLLSAKPEIVVPDSGISFSKFSVEWRIMQFFYLLCSQFRQKASSWINKTLLLVKRQKWLSEFCVKMHRVASKNWGRSGDRKHTYYFFWSYLQFTKFF